MQRDRSTALLQACHCNHPGVVKVLLENNSNVNLADKVFLLLSWEGDDIKSLLTVLPQDGTTALATAVSKNAYEMVQMLIEKGADVNCIRVRIYSLNCINQLNEYLFGCNSNLVPRSYFQHHLLLALCCQA